MLDPSSLVFGRALLLFAALRVLAGIVILKWG
mgnify:CR=1 FL=1